MRKKLLIGIGILFILIIWLSVSVYPNWLWFENLSYSSVFWTVLISKVAFGFVVWLFLILIISLNLFLAKRFNPDKRGGTDLGDENSYFSQLGISTKTTNFLFIGFILVVSFFIASKGSAEWDLVLRYLYQVPFEGRDPIFNRDIGFYVFSLPFYLFIQNGLFILFILAGLIIVWWYLKNGALQTSDRVIQADGRPIALPKVSISLKAQKHLIFLGGIVVLLLAWGYYLKVYKLLYSTQGPAFGASYTDVYIKLWANRGMAILSAILALILFVNAFKPQKRVLVVSGAAWLGVLVVATIILPTIVQKFMVKPNELAKESPYIAFNIDYTRRAYNLNKIKEMDFPVSEKLTLEDVKQQNVTIIHLYSNSIHIYYLLF